MNRLPSGDLTEVLLLSKHVFTLYSGILYFTAEVQRLNGKPNLQNVYLSERGCVMDLVSNNGLPLADIHEIISPFLFLLIFTVQRSLYFGSAATKKAA